MPEQKYAPIRTEEDGDGDSISSHERRSLPTSIHQPYSLKSIGINTFLFATGLLIGFLVQNGRKSPNCGAEDLMAQYAMIPSPAFEAIENEPLILTPHEMEGHGHKSPYQGYPTEERTALWMEMMQGYSIRVPSTSLSALNLESIPLNDNSGDAWVSMNIYHHLHCLDSIRHQVAGKNCTAQESNPHENHDDHYAHDSDEPWFPPHIDHCIETLRKRLICQPDLGVRAIAWEEGWLGVAKANNTVASACVNWDAVQEWTRKHSFTMEEELITVPEDGGVYPGPRTPIARCGE